VGGLLWTEGVLLAGYSLARQITNLIPPEKLDAYLLPVIALIVLLSAMPIFVEVWRHRRQRRRAAAAAAVAQQAVVTSRAQQRVEED
jgi:membrane-associated protein